MFSRKDLLSMLDPTLVVTTAPIPVHYFRRDMDLTIIMKNELFICIMMTLNSTNIATIPLFNGTLTIVIIRK